MQAASGMAQFRKLEGIVALQKRHHEKLKQMLADAGLPIEFREMPDPHGDNGDTLFFFTETSAKASEIVGALNANNIGTKNVPDAMNWHFAAHWDHMLAPFYKRPLT